MEEFLITIDSVDMIKSNILSPTLLIRALKELDKMIGMDEVKSTIIQQIKFLLVNKNHENHMLHTVIYGPPGVGKTKLGRILAKIWVSLGLIKTDKVKDKHYYQSKVRTLKRKYDDINKNVTQDLEYNKFCIGCVDSNLRTIREKDLSRKRRRRIWDTVYQDIDYIATRFDKTRTILDTKPEEEPQPTDPFVNSEPDIVVVKRDDFLAKYCGQTAIKTRNLLMANIGKILFIDEAYSLINADRDSFGMEALTVLNEFMSTHPHEIIIIFAGYRELLEQTIFKAQPGLKRRCTWIYEVPSYKAPDLVKIFRLQIHEHNWIIDNKCNLDKIFHDNYDKFPNFGGDTERLAFYCKLEYSSEKFTDQNNDRIITHKMILGALRKLSSNSIKDKCPPPENFYL